MTAYYNEFDKKTANWLKELIKEGLIADGIVDQRDIRDIEANEIKGFTQYHFFAGIGGWSYALRLAGWDDSRPVLTGSPPCQPFSNAGRGLGTKDERHLAPVWLELVKSIRPSYIFGEQVATAVKKDNWLDDLLNELEDQGYTTGAAVLPACIVGSPHIRQRLWFTARMADNTITRLETRSSLTGNKQIEQQRLERLCSTGGMAYSNESGWERQSGSRREEERGITQCGLSSGLVYNDNPDKSGRTYESETGWDNPDWLWCRDAKWRPVESGTFPLADGVSARVGRLRGYGNAIVPQVASEIIKSIM